MSFSLSRTHLLLHAVDDHQLGSSTSAVLSALGPILQLSRDVVELGVEISPSLFSFCI